MMPMNRGAMPPEEIPGPGPVDAPPPGQEQGVVSKESVGYHGPEERCSACKHFDGQGLCNLNRFEADPDGHCTKFEGGDVQQTDEGAEAELVDEPIGEPA